MTERLPFQFSLSCFGEGSGDPLQCSCLEKPRDGRAWWAAVYGVAQSRTRLKRHSSSSSSSSCLGYVSSHFYLSSKSLISLQTKLLSQCLQTFCKHTHWASPTPTPDIKSLTASHWPFVSLTREQLNSRVQESTRYWFTLRAGHTGGHQRLFVTDWKCARTLT